MENNILVSSYSFNKSIYKHTHSAGPEVYFTNPCIGYVTKDYGNFLYKGQTFYVNKGDLIYIAYKHNIMIQNALDLLAHTNLSIEEISTQIGLIIMT